MVWLAKRLLGETAVRLVSPDALPGDAALARVDGETRIYLRTGLSQTRLRFAVAHELAHWALDIGSASLDGEQLCDALAAALVAPRPAFHGALRDVGERYPVLADRFGTSESCIVLRWGEVTGTPTALVTPSSVRVRGGAFDWPDEDGIRALAMAPRGAGIRRAVLGDDQQRVALIAA
jgi:hypothetical protein